jgi:AcrR family transcriptional regulator
VQLLAAAREIFATHGYHAAAMDDIANHAGVSKPVLYQHFPGKLELYLALLDEATEEFLNRLHQALASTTDNKQRVLASLTAYLQFVDDESGYYRLLFESDLVNVPQVKQRLDELTSACSHEIAAVIKEDTGLSNAESDLLAMGLVGMAETTARYWKVSQTSQTSLSRDAAADLVATLGWRGIRGFPMRSESPSP